MALAQELPDSFVEALKLTQSLLSRNISLVRTGVIESEAEQIVMAAYRKTEGVALSRVEFHVRMKDRLPEAAAKQVILWANLRSEGKLLQHLIGYQQFLDHDYDVSPAVLIPRPETEVLVTEAISRLKSLSPRLGLEVGLGSGIISIELLLALPSLQMKASELTSEAIECAKRNSTKLLGPDATRLQILQASAPGQVLDVFKATLTTPVDFIISNPPYLRRGIAGDALSAGVEAPEVDDDVLVHEPASALFAPADDVLYFYREIAHHSPALLKAGGLVFLEIPHERASEIAELFAYSPLAGHSKNPQWTVTTLKDLNQRDRILVAKYG
ncbi:MAG: peptide chain release factor N(5)-glutamine methyltransferase [Methylotenera sp.]|nr:peptide chain release factor N(5)-glutamine methyltransferase [Oligoflexia bacterium]